MTIARDRLGEKPLYYAVTPDGFLLFASELTAIRAAGVLTLRHRHEALHDYFFYGYVPDPKTIYEDVYKLPPGSTLTLERGKAPLLKRYWRPAFQRSGIIDFEEAKSRLLALLDDAVAAQMIADVPLGAFLSGGVELSHRLSPRWRSRANT